MIKIQIMSISIAIFIIICGCSRKFIFEDESEDILALAELYKSDNWEKRRETINRICMYKSSNAVDLLIAALDDTHSIIRIDALKCLGSKREKRAKRIIRRIAEFDTNTNVRLVAIQALAKYKDSSAAPFFAKGLVDEDWLIREESIKGLLMIDDIFIQQVSIPYIIEALNDPRINVRLSALEHLSIKDERLFNELSGIINDNNNFYRITLLKACMKAINGYILDKGTRDRLIEFLTHPNKDIRILALGILKKDKELQAIEEEEGD